MPRATGIASSRKNPVRTLIAAGILALTGLAPAASAGGGCNPADLAPPAGVLDLADVAAFVAGFSGGDLIADLSGDGILDLQDVALFITHFTGGCPTVECFPDVRTTIDDALSDPPQIQSNYDAINRSIHLFGSFSFGAVYAQPAGAILPAVLERLESIDQCVTAPTDSAAIAVTLQQIAALTGPTPLGQVLSAEGVDPFLASLFEQLNDLGVAVPTPPATPGEALARQAALPGLTSVAASVGVADLFFRNINEVTEEVLAAIDAARDTGLANSRILNNDKCCVRGGGSVPGTDACRTDTQFCSLPPPSRAFCSLGSKRCTASSACFPDIRTTIDDADNDPADIQSNYDAINRTIHIFGPLSFAQVFAQPAGAVLPILLDRLETLNECVAAPSNTPAIAVTLQQLAAATGPVPIGQVLSNPGSDPFVASLLQQLRDLGLGIPELPNTPDEAAARLAALPGLTSVAGSVTIADLFFKNVYEVSEPQLLAIDTGKTSGLVFAAICNNSKCCVSGGGPIPGTDACRTDTKFCNLPPPSRAFCSIASDKCP